MRKTIKFSLSKVGKSEIFDSHLDITYIDMEGKKNKVEYSGEAYRVKEIFNGVQISKIISLEVVEDDDFDPEIYVVTPTKRISIGYIQSRLGYALFPVSPTEGDISSLKHFLSKIEDEVEKIEDELRFADHEVFSLGGEK